MKWETPKSLIAYLRASPSSDAGRAAADMIEAKEAEVERLREALQLMLDRAHPAHVEDCFFQRRLIEARETARAALAQEES